MDISDTLVLTNFISVLSIIGSKESHFNGLLKDVVTSCTIKEILSDDENFRLKSDYNLSNT